MYIYIYRMYGWKFPRAWVTQTSTGAAFARARSAFAINLASHTARSKRRRRRSKYQLGKKYRRRMDRSFSNKTSYREIFYLHNMRTSFRHRPWYETWPDGRTTKTPPKNYCQVELSRHLTREINTTWAVAHSLTHSERQKDRQTDAKQRAMCKIR